MRQRLASEVGQTVGFNAAQPTVVLWWAAAVFEDDRRIGEQPRGVLAVEQRSRNRAVDLAPQILFAND